MTMSCAKKRRVKMEAEPELEIVEEDPFEKLKKVTFTPSDTPPITINLGLDLDFEENMVQPTVLDFDEDEGTIFNTKNFHKDMYNDDGGIDPEHLNTMFDSLEDSGNCSDNDLLFGNMFNVKNNQRYNSDSDPDEFSFSPPSTFQFDANKWKSINWTNHLTSTVPKPEIVIITNENNTLTCSNIMYSKSELHTSSKVIEV